MMSARSGDRWRRLLTAWRRPFLTLALLLMLSAPSAAALPISAASNPSPHTVVAESATQSDQVAFTFMPLSSWSI